ncbi:MAG: MFS transporter [Alphaproteobacteria bacterium]
MIERRILIAVCGAQLLGMANYAGFPALLPTFVALWGLSNAQAGWISGIYFGGYTLAVPVLVSLTDRIDPRCVYLWAMALAAASCIGYALLADGFWSALVFRAGAGIGLAGTYMPALKALSDRTPDSARARVVGYYTTTYSAAASLSFVFIGLIEEAIGWRWAFGLAGAGAILAALLVGIVLPPAPPQKAAGSWREALAALDFRAVVSNRRALGFMLAYMAVVWAASANRSWFVALFVFSASMQEPGAIVWSATLSAALLNLVSLPANIMGNELAIRLGAPRAIAGLFIAAAVMACVFASSLDRAYLVVVAVGVLYILVLNANATSVTAGTVVAAEAERRGATMALHSCLGFFGGFLGPLIFGYVLDFGGGSGAMAAWFTAFATLAVVCVLGALSVTTLARGARLV